MNTSLLTFMPLFGRAISILGSSSTASASPSSLTHSISTLDPGQLPASILPRSHAQGKSARPSSLCLTRKLIAGLRPLSRAGPCLRTSWIRASASAAQDGLNPNSSVQQAQQEQQQQQQQHSSNGPAQQPSGATAPLAKRAMPPVKDRVELNELEKELFSTLLAAAQRAPTPTTLRHVWWALRRMVGSET